MQVWQSALLASIPGVVHGVSTRLGGVSRPPFATLNLSLQTGDRMEDVIENRRRFLARLGFNLDAAVWGEQVHGTVVRQVTRRDAAEKGVHAFPATDGLVTTQRGLALMAFFADCLPIMAAEEGGRAAGVAHAGWRGTIAGVARQLIVSLRACGVAPERIKVALGPCIKPCCYAVSEELYQRFRDEIGPQAVGRTRSGRPALDLAGANTALLVAAGVPESAIEVSPICTACRTDLFFSHRAERGNTGRFAAVVGLL